MYKASSSSQKQLSSSVGIIGFEIYYLRARGWWGVLLMVKGGRVTGLEDVSTLPVTLLTVSSVKLMLGFLTKISL